ncbi:MAG: diguanylate cyclase [Chloroflexi bacterium]|nr:diguanylate cyclase [Chloroflexota bacterium]
MKILVAEDEPGSRRLVKMVLSAAGYEVVEAVDGQEAWEIFQREPFQLIVTDWMMPRLDGAGLIQNIRAIQKSYTYIIMLTAIDGKPKVVMGLEAGADEYLTKPFNRQELLARIASGKRILRLEEQLTEARQQVEVLAMHDGLTGLLNRRAIEEHAGAEFKMVARKERPMSVIMLDVDHFKNVNDQFGHAIGDQVLRQVAKVLQENSRGYDRVGRWGGEEFLLILPDTELRDAALVAERLRTQTAGTKIPLESGESISVQISLGVACTVNGFPSLAKLIEAADQSLYKAKQTGRNRVCIHESEP